MAKQPKVIENEELIKEWDWEKNNELGFNPNKLTCGSQYNVWWKCKEGHEYLRTIKNQRDAKNNGQGLCKRCLLLKTNLATEYPLLSQQWLFEKNKGCPSDYSPHSSAVVWWKCEKGHEWEERISQRTSKKIKKCPICAGYKIKQGYNNLSITHPELKKEWHHKKNEKMGLVFDTFDKPKNTSVWWKCEEGHEWEEKISDYIYHKNKCPYCNNRKMLIGYNDLSTIRPDLLKEWDFEKNKVSPYTIHTGSEQKVWWKCNRGHEWEATVAQRVGYGKHMGTNCPHCYKETNTSFAEQSVFFYLSKYFDCENRKKIDGVEIDIFIPDLQVGIEYDGIYWHNLQGTHKKEKNKEKFCKQHNIALYRIKESNINKTEGNYIYFTYQNNLNNLPFAIKTILSLLGINDTIDINIDKDRINIYNQYIMHKKQQSFAHLYPTFALEWHPTKNQGLDPKFFSPHSRKKIWWLCKNGHEYEATIAHRVGSNSSPATNCPYCSNRKVLQGYNDLAFINPDILKEWDYQKNTINPTQITSGSAKKAWWICSKCGHEWKSEIRGRTQQGHNCPKCVLNNKIITLEKIDKALFEQLYKQFQKKEITKTQFAKELNIGFKTLNKLLQNKIG